jgi:RNA polymerase sigma factor (sigma-70 family)
VSELAFGAIVDRHGPMVRRICRQMLGNVHDADDAFQATFFILARKARSVHTHDSVASWLHGVAYRVCLRARSATDRRRVHERKAATLAGAGASGFNVCENSDRGELLHAELARLPERFRAPILLCDLEGLAYEEAARLLGCPVGTIKSRLARGRERLRVRVARRGVAPSPGVLVATVSKSLVPSTLRDATAHAAIRFTMHGPPAVGMVSTSAAALTEGMLRTMILFRLKIAAVVLALTAFGSTAMGVLVRSGPGEQPSTAPGQDAQIVAQPRPSRTQAASFPAGPISKIEIEGNATVTSDKIKPKLLSRVGQPLDQDRVEADLETLMATKWFSDVRYYLDESPPKTGKWALIFVVREMPLLTKVEFRGRKAIRLKEIEDTTELKAGNRADPMRARLAVSQIQRLYVEKAYDLASVTLVEGGNTGETKVVIEIFEGPKVKVNSISFEGNHFASDAQLRIKIAARKPILGPIGKYHSNMLDEDRRKLIEYYQSQGFFEVKGTPVTRPGAEPGTVDLTFVVSEGTRYKVRNVVIEGNTKLKTEFLRENLELHSGKPFTEAVREADKNRMLIKYGEIGCLDVQIAGEHRFTNELGVVDLVYKIVEGEPFMLDKLKIRENLRTNDKLFRREAVRSGLLPREVLDEKPIEVLPFG